MSTLQLLRLPQDDVGAAEPALVLAAPPAAAVCADGRLLLPPDGAAGGSDTPGVSAWDSYALVLRSQGDNGPPAPLPVPWGALCALPSRGGLLFAQRGCRRLLFCQHPGALAPGQAADVFLLGSHEAPIAAIAASPCGGQALSLDERGGLGLWSLADGTQLAAVPAPDGSSQPEAAAAPHAAAACFLQDGLVATAACGGSGVRLWSLPFLRQQAELGSSPCSPGLSPLVPAVTSLAASGQLLAVGCSDGSGRLWHRSGLARFEPRTLLPPLQQQPAGGAAAAVSCLAFSGDASLLAAAAGSAVGICCTASGRVLGQRVLAAAPLALHWGPHDSLLATLPSGELQRLGAPEAQTATPVQQPAPTVLPAAGSASSWPLPAVPPPSLLPEQRQALPARGRPKVVRFAEPESGDAAAEPAPSSCLLAPAVGAPLHPRPPIGGRAVPPQLPAHPLVACSAAGRARAASGSIGHSGAGPAIAQSSWPLQPLVAPSPRQPLYPILDLRALRGMQPAAMTQAAACEPAPLPAETWPAACLAAAPATASLRQAGSTGPSSLAAASSRQWMARLCSEGSAAQPAAPGEAVPAAEGDEEAPRPLSLPQPVARPSSPRASKQHCSACHALTPGAAAQPRRSRSGGSSSPAKAAMLAHLEQLQREADAGEVQADGASRAADASARGSGRPASPIKVGTMCKLQAQEAAGEEQPPEARPFTVVEHDSRLASWEARSTRYARISRRCVFATPAAALDGEQAAAEPPELPPQQGDQEQSAAPARALPGDSVAVDAQQQQPAGSPPAERLDAISLTAPACEPAAAAAAAVQATAGQGSPQACCFAVASDDELSDSGGIAEGGVQHQREWQQDQRQQQLGRVTSRLLQLGGELSGLAATAKRKAAAAAAAPPLSLPPQPAASVTEHIAPVPANRPAAAAPPLPTESPDPKPCALACPQPNSSLLLARREWLQQKQAAMAAAAPLPEVQLAAARQLAATSATTLPSSARLYAGLPPPPLAACQVSPQKAAALAGVRKHLDARWAAERRELQPELGQLWTPAERLPGRPACTDLPIALPVPLPDPARLAAAFLGLRL